MEIKEDYVSFETAKLLKQKGFSVPVRTFYNPKYRGEKVSDGTALINYNADPEDATDRDIDKIIREQNKLVK